MTPRHSDLFWSAVLTGAATAGLWWLVEIMPWWGLAIFWFVGFSIVHNGFIKDRARDRQAYGPD